MPFEFPTAPAVNDEYTTGGIIYQWDGTVWAIKGGSDPQDYVLKAGDTMTGALSFGPATVTAANDHSRHLHMWSGGSNGGFGLTVTSGRLNFNVDATTNSHFFRVANVDKFQVHNTGIGVLSGNISVVDGYLELNNQGIFLDRTASGYGDSPKIEWRRGTAYAARILGTVSNNTGYSEWGGLDIQVNHGSYGNQNVLDVTPGQGAAYANVCSLSGPAFNVTSDARLKENVRPVTQDEVTRLFGALRPVHYDRLTVLGEGATPEQCERSTPEYGFVADDIAVNGKELVATMNVNKVNTLVYSLSQVLAITIAKVRQLETDIAALKGAGP